MLQLRKPFQFDSVALIVLAIIAVDVYGQTTTKSTLATLEPASKKIEQVPDGVDAKIWKRLVDLGVKAGKIKDLQASFVQEKHTVLLKKPLVSSGTLKVMGRVMLWETLKPHPSAVWMDGRQVKMYYPADQLVEIYPLGAKASMPAWPLLQPVAMARQFRIQPVPQGHKKNEGKWTNAWSIRLIPRKKKLADRWTHIDLHLDSKTGYLLGASMLDVDGDRTETRLSKVVTNQKLKIDDLKLNLPKGVKVVRPIPANAAKP